jgi:Domain of unknown function (DUF4340)
MTAIFLVKSPSSPLVETGQTPSPTAAPRLIEELTTDAGSDTIRLVKQTDGSWTNEATQAGVEAGKVEQIQSELLATRILLVMPVDYSLDSLSLTAPVQSITITQANGKTMRVQIGGLTPTGNGYYVRVDDQAPVVVSKYALDAVVELFADVNAATPTPELPVLSESTPTPTP